MKKLLLLLTTIFMVATSASAQSDEAPLYKGFAEITVNEDYAPYYDASFPQKKGLLVEGYDGYFIVRAYAGVEGYDLMIEYDDNDNVISLTPIINGEEGETVTNGYCTVNTGLEGDSKFLQFYIGKQYAYAGVDPDDNSGYTLLSAYNAAGAYVYYYLVWDAYPEDCLYIELGETSSTEGWGTTFFPNIRDIKVEAYDGYVIARAWAGVEGYDMMVEVGDNDAIISVTPIVNGEEADMGTKGYFNIPTGRDDFSYIQAYLGSGYCYGGLYEDNSGYIILNCYIGDEWTYYYIAWPQEEEGSQQEWVNPFEGEATFLYSATAKATSVEEDDPTAEDAWGPTIFPEVDNIAVDVYDKYIYIHALGGVEGYDAKVAYNADEEVLSIISVVNGEESEPCKSYIYLYTGRQDWTTIQAYPSMSNAASYDDNRGYVVLAAYIYNADDSFEWNYYNITWDAADTGITPLTTTRTPAATYNLAGQQVTPAYKGLVIQNGKKHILK